MSMLLTGKGEDLTTIVRTIVFSALLLVGLVQMAIAVETQDSKVTAPDPHQLAADHFANRAMSLTANYKFTEALDLFDRSIQTKPTLRAHRMRGAIRFKLGDIQGAMDDFATCIRLEPTNPENHITRAVMRQLLGDHAGAIADYSNVINLQPEAARSWGNRGLAKMKMGDLVSAERDLDRALELMPDYPEGLYNRGVVRQNRKDYTGAIADYNRALKLRPDWDDVLHNINLANQALAKINDAR